MFSVPRGRPSGLGAVAACAISSSRGDTAGIAQQFIHVLSSAKPVVSSAIRLRNFVLYYGLVFATVLKVLSSLLEA